MNHPPTDEQTSILDLLSTDGPNLMINALAGTGKTNTLERIEKVTKAKPILYLVFAVKNKTEAEEKMLSTTTVRNFNGLGHRIWAQAVSHNLSLNKKKIQDLTVELIKSAPKNVAGPMWDSLWSVVAGVNMAKALGYVPEGKYPDAKRLCSQTELHMALEEQPDDLISDMIDEVLTKSIALAYKGVIDFNDQLYMPALFGGKFPTFPLVMVDEDQDLNPVQWMMVDKLCRQSRLVGVGDPWQNIYGFRGAKADGMKVAVSKYKMEQRSLSVSFRCPEQIVRNAQWRVPHYRWHKPGGHVEILRSLSPASIPDDAGIICRNNAPLFKVALNLLASGRSVAVAGSDIGPKVVGLMKKLGPSDTPQAHVMGLIDDWESEKLAKESTTASDMAQCMRVFAQYGSDLSSAMDVARHMFNQAGSIQLLTGHKAKGMEYEQVYHLDPHLIRTDEQDLNLRYVVQTRSLDRYYEVNSMDIQW